jgi:hypothetical protein
MIAEPAIPELVRVTASAITEVLATQFKLAAIASAPANTPVTGPPGHQLELEIHPGAKTCWSNWTCEGHLLRLELQLNFKST